MRIYAAFIKIMPTVCNIYTPSSGTTQISLYQRGKTNLDFTEKSFTWLN